MTDKNSSIYKKHIQPSIERDKKRKRSIRKAWWTNNWIALVSLIVAIIALAVSVIALLV